jgi:hypothetical protein
MQPAGDDVLEEEIVDDIGDGIVLKRPLPAGRSTAAGALTYVRRATVAPPPPL